MRIKGVGAYILADDTDVQRFGFFVFVGLRAFLLILRYLTSIHQAFNIVTFVCVDGQLVITPCRLVWKFLDGHRLNRLVHQTNDHLVGDDACSIRRCDGRDFVPFIPPAWSDLVFPY